MRPDDYCPGCGKPTEGELSIGEYRCGDCGRLLWRLTRRRVIGLADGKGKKLAATARPVKGRT